MAFSILFILFALLCPAKLDLFDSFERNICEIFDNFQLIQSKVLSPIPSKMIYYSNDVDDDVNVNINVSNSVIHLECFKRLMNDNPQYLNQQTHDGNIDPKGILWLMECWWSNDVGCKNLMKILNRIVIDSHRITRRIFALILLYDITPESYWNFSQRFWMETKFNKLHAVLISSNINPVLLIRPLKNVCLIEKSFKLIQQWNYHTVIRALFGLDHQYHPIKCDLRGQNLSAILMKNVRCDYDVDFNGEIILRSSIEINALKHFSRRYNFSIRGIDFQGTYGKQDDNGTWIGSIGMVVNQTADLAMCDLVFNYDRSNVVDFLFPFDVEPVTFFIKEPDMLVNKWAILALPRDIWISILVTFLVLLLLIKYYFRFRFSASRVPSNLETFAIVLLLVALFFKQSSIRQDGRHLIKSSLRWIILLWCFVTLVLTCAYGAMFFSNITVPRLQQPIETINELHQHAIEDKVMIYMDRYLLDLVLEAKCCDDILYHLGQHLSRNNIAFRNFSFNPVDVLTTLTILRSYDWKKGRPLVFISTRSQLKFFAKHLAPLIHVHFSSQSIMTDLIGMAHQKDSLYQPWFNKQLNPLRDFGFLEKWNEDSLKLKSCYWPVPPVEDLMYNQPIDLDSDPSEESEHEHEHEHSSAKSHSEYHSLYLDQLESVFILYFCGMLVAFLALIIQNCYYWYRMRKLSRIKSIRKRLSNNQNILQTS